MDLSATQRNDKKNDSWKKDRQCYNCQKIGHLAYECRSPKKERFQPYQRNDKRVSPRRRSLMNNSTGPPASMTTAISTLAVRNTQDGTPRNLKNDLVTTPPTHLNGPSLWDIEATAKSSARQSNSSTV
ncbi:uncharacterized protein CTRU02_206781 [Colletotrichum truncatum]|uniref:Uncharacterized protein n=1 Tax=Colletotrichum truncatum TaxID=5467 RepID=A0ACC3YYQ0_COLTU